jgi:hypothetical protein
MSPDGRPTDGVTSRSHQTVRHLLPPARHFPGAGRLKNWPVPANDESLNPHSASAMFLFQNDLFLILNIFSSKRIFL